MEFKGRINLRELEKQHIEVTATERDSWFRSVLLRSAPSPDLTGLSADEWADKALIKASARVEKIGTEYFVKGELEGALQNPCSRCGDPFKAARKAEFQLVMHKMPRGELANQEDSGDADYQFFEGDEISLIDIFSEQLIVLEPVAECPLKDASGACLQCGLNPQFGLSSGISESPGQGVENKAFSGLSAWVQDLRGQDPKKKSRN